MAHPLLNTPAAQKLVKESVSVPSRNERFLAPIADACFEMFAVRELKKPLLILPELRAAFPEFRDEEILQAVSLALSWKRLLKAAGKPIH